MGNLLFLSGLPVIFFAELSRFLAVRGDMKELRIGTDGNGCKKKQKKLFQTSASSAVRYDMTFPLHSKNPGRGLTLTVMRKRLGFFQKRRVPRAGYAETDSK